MINLKEAKKIVEQKLKEHELEINSFGSSPPDNENPKIELVILDKSTQEHDFGWVFFYNSKKFLETNDFRDCIAGNAPLIVNRESGELFETGTSHHIEHYISNYKSSGDPLK